jgi:dTDP-glucose 4,6-dehydratase
MTKILVTGGKGFIGTNLTNELTSRGYEVWTCDIFHAEDENHLRADVSSYCQLERIFEKHSFNYVYHLAAEYGRWNGEDYYENLWRTNAIGTKRRSIGFVRFFLAVVRSMEIMTASCRKMLWTKFLLSR